MGCWNGQMAKDEGTESNESTSPKVGNYYKA